MKRRSKSTLKSAPPVSVEPKLRGSLIFLGIGLLASPAGPIGNLIGLLPLLNAARWKAMLDIWAPNYRPLLAPLLIFEIAGNLALAGCGVALFVLFLRRHYAVPRLAIAFLVGHLTYAVVNRLGIISVPAVALEYDTNALLDIVGKTALCALLMPYLENSTIVRNYFTRGRRARKVADERDDLAA